MLSQRRHAAHYVVTKTKTRLVKFSILKKGIGIKGEKIIETI